MLALNIIGGLLGGIFGAGGNKRNDTSNDLERQKEFAKQQSKEATDAAIFKMGQDTKSGIAAGIMDSATKSLNSTLSSAKSIQF